MDYSSLLQGLMGQQSAAPPVGGYSSIAGEEQTQEALKIFYNKHKICTLGLKV